MNWHGGCVRLACDELKERVKGKKIALMMNTTALDNEGRFLLDRMVDEQWASIAFLFGMEHGVRGNLFAGDGKLEMTDTRTGLPIVNLYDYPKCQPPAERLCEVDAVVFCAQDVGVRHWTYTPWMMLLLESAATVGCEVIILDRPNPIRGDIVEGAPARTEYAGKHLLSGFEYPLRHGMTIGELALMYCDVKKLSLTPTVLRMEGWKREMWFSQTGLPWVPASPNMPTTDTALYFATTGLLQGSNLSLGAGSTTPFQYVGGTDLDGEALARTLNAQQLPGISFLQKYYMTVPYERLYRGDRTPVLTDGVLLLIEDRDAFRAVDTQLVIMETLQKLFSNRVQFDHHCVSRARMGTDEICDALAAGKGLSNISAQWRADAEAFARARTPYLLY